MKRKITDIVINLVLIAIGSIFLYLLIDLFIGKSVAISYISVIMPILLILSLIS